MNFPSYAILVDLIEANIYLLTVFIGLITFSIPFLWNAYQKILDLKERTTGEMINNILTIEIRQKSLRYFVYFVQLPTSIMVFIGLFIVPLFFSFQMGFLVLSLFFLYFVALPLIFQKIQDKSFTNLMAFLTQKPAEADDVKVAFQELWRKDDTAIEKEFSIKPLQVFNLFSQKIDSLLTNNNTELVQKYLEDFSSFINNRSIFYLVVRNEILIKILDWHFKIWETEYKYLCEENKHDEWSKYSELSRVLDSILRKIEERSLKEGQLFSFFNVFKKHAEQYKKRFVDSDDRQFYYYETLFEIFYQVFFQVIDSLVDKYGIWSYFPEEWKVTKHNLENSDNIISRVSFNEFFPWADGRIGGAGTKADPALNNVSSNLFPEVDSMAWATILRFLFFGYGERPVQSVIERPWNFGHDVRYRGPLLEPIQGENQEEIEKKSRERTEKEKKKEIENTFDLVYFLPQLGHQIFEEPFSEKKIEEYLKELENLQYPKNSEQEHKQLILRRIFTEMLEYVRQQK